MQQIQAQMDLAARQQIAENNLHQAGFDHLAALVNLMTEADFNNLYGQSLKSPASMIVRLLCYRTDRAQNVLLTNQLFKEYGFSDSILLDKNWKTANSQHLRDGTVPAGLANEQAAFRNRRNASLRMRQVFFIHHAAMLRVKEACGHNLSENQERLINEVWTSDQCDEYFHMFSQIVAGQNLVEIQVRKDFATSGQVHTINVPTSVRDDPGLTQWILAPWGLVRR